MTAWMPPAWYRSSMWCVPAGAILQMCGTLAATSLMRRRSKSRPASVAMAARWSTVLVLQPRLASAARALPTAASVRMSRGLRSAASTCMTCSPLSLAKRMRSL